MICAETFSSFAKSLDWNVHTHSDVYREFQLARGASFLRNKRKSLLSAVLYSRSMSTIMITFVVISLSSKPITSVSHECPCPYLPKMKAVPSLLSTDQSSLWLIICIQADSTDDSGEATFVYETRIQMYLLNIHRRGLTNE